MAKKQIKMHGVTGISTGISCIHPKKFQILSCLVNKKFQRFFSGTSKGESSPQPSLYFLHF